jgi:vacuolar protein sorting-associated protein VTA1
MNIPQQLKGLTAFVKRAEELDRETVNPDAKVVAYFCRTFAVERGIKLKAEGPEVNPFLMQLMNILDKEKACVAGVSHEDRKLICERFAYNVFSKADDEDRAGLGDKNTAKTFYAAATFLEILEQFGELDSDVCSAASVCLNMLIVVLCVGY